VSGDDGVPWHLRERRAATVDDAVTFLRTLAELEAKGLRGTSANLGNGPRLEEARQIARKRGWCKWPGSNGQGWLLTESGRVELARTRGLQISNEGVEGMSRKKAASDTAGMADADASDKAAPAAIVIGTHANPYTVDEMAAAIADAPAYTLPTPAPRPMRAVELALEDVFASPLNPRRIAPTAEQDREFEGNIAAWGILQPIVVRPSGGPAPGAAVAAAPTDRPLYEIICGSRRHAACLRLKAAGRLPADYRIPATIREASDKELIVMAGSENLERADMHPLDEAALFEALRPYVDAAERAIAAELHVSERTVFRRLALLRCIAPVQAALRDGKISLRQAMAFAIGKPADQKEFWAETFDGLEDESPDDREDMAYQRDAARIRAAMTEATLPLALAAFTIEAYREAGGTVAEDPESGEYFAIDAKLFRKLQLEAAAARCKEIMATGKWPWVELLPKDVQSWKYEDARGKDKEAGVLVYLDDQSNSVEIRIRENVLRPGTVARRQREAAELKGHNGAPAKGKKGKAGDAEPIEENERAYHAATSGPSTPRYYLTDGQSHMLHRAKTRAMRRGVAAQPTVAVALAVLAMLASDSEVNIRASGYLMQRPENNQGDPPKADVQRLDTLTKGMSLPRRWRQSQGTWTSKMQAAIFLELQSLEWDRLIELFAALVAERVGTWCHNGESRYGDTTLAITIAQAVSAPRYLQELWQPDEAYFAAFSKETLVGIAKRAAEAGGAIAEGTEKMKKGELVAYLLTFAPHTWRPELFVETQWLTDAAQKKAFAKGETAPLEEDVAQELGQRIIAGEEAEADGIEEMIGKTELRDRGGMP
jgi:ParB/RepB/Spo0J family partition protein